MAKLLDQILVIDLESTCWEGAPPEGQSGEIIQIGICGVDVSSLRRLEKKSILVRPTHSQIGDFCTNLTGLTTPMFTDAVTFPEALRILKSEYHCKDRVWASWGDYDRRQFERQCANQKMAFPFGPTHLNVKSLFAITIGLDRELGLDGAYEQLGLKMEGQHHRGDDDAWNISAFLVLLLQQMRQRLTPA
jgi:inhibitor of KinA sporulation pathway (predicted exonuclease)